MDLRQIRYFIAVADACNFSRAAERLHVSQPPLSIQIKRLEDEIGVRLLNRSPRGVELTPAGALFYEDAKAALARLDGAKKRARQAELGEVGTLSIGFVSIVDYGVLPPALKDFRTRYPRIEVELHEATTDQQVQALRNGRFDLALALGPVREADLKFEPLIEEELLLALPARHPLAGADRATDLRRFSEETFIARACAGPARCDRRALSQQRVHTAHGPAGPTDADGGEPGCLRAGRCAGARFDEQPQAQGADLSPPARGVGGAADRLADARGRELGDRAEFFGGVAGQCRRLAVAEHSPAPLSPRWREGLSPARGREERR
jgi:DNA-binding transcriptional LysR family regulator